MSIRHLNKILVSALVLVSLSTEAYAQQKLGAVITNVSASVLPLQFLLSSFAYITGLYFAIVGVFKFKDHVDSPQQHPLSAGVKRFLAGGFMLASPYTINALQGTMFGSGVPTIASSGRHGAMASTGGIGMDQMIYNLITDVAGPAEMLLNIFAYLSGIILTLVGISRLIKTAQEGPRGPTGMGTILTFVAAGGLFSFGGSMGVFTSSLFGDATLLNYVSISPTILSNATDQARVASVIESVMIFIMLVGYIAFIRGLFVLKAFGDGSSNATMAQALTFLIGGALAINLGELVNVLQASVGISGITFG